MKLSVRSWPRSITTKLKCQIWNIKPCGINGVLTMKKYEPQSHTFFLRLTLSCNAYILTFNSKPIRSIMELKYTKIMMIRIVPMDPYTLLYVPNLLTQIEKIKVSRIISAVARVVPGENKRHFSFVAGACL